MKTVLFTPSKSQHEPCINNTEKASAKIRLGFIFWLLAIGYWLLAIFTSSAALAVEVQIYPKPPANNPYGDYSEGWNTTGVSISGWSQNHLAGQTFKIPPNINSITRVRLTNFKLGDAKAGGFISVALFEGTPNATTGIQTSPEGQLNPLGLQTTIISLPGPALAIINGIFIPGEDPQNDLASSCGIPGKSIVTDLLRQIRIDNSLKPCPKKSEWIRMWNIFTAQANAGYPGWQDKRQEWVNGRDYACGPTGEDTCTIEGFGDPNNLPEDGGVGSVFTWSIALGDDVNMFGTKPAKYEGPEWVSYGGSKNRVPDSSFEITNFLVNTITPGLTYFLSIQGIHDDPNRGTGEGEYWETGRYNCEDPNNVGQTYPGSILCGKGTVLSTRLSTDNPYTDGRAFFNDVYFLQDAVPLANIDMTDLTIWGNQAAPPPPPPPSGELDCLNPVTAPLTYSPMEGPATRVVFRPSGPFVAPPEGITCSDDRDFNLGQYSRVVWSNSFRVEDLESVFAKYISDYSEGEFQDTTLTHQQENLLNLTSSQWNDYNGPIQKLAPKIMFNENFGDDLSGLKIRYVDYAIDPRKATRQDVQFTYTDIYGQVPPPFTEPPTIAQLAAAYGLPRPPPATPNEVWQDTWGRFWDKIPIAKNDKAEGTIAVGAYQVNLDGTLRPICAVFPFYKIVVPEYFRTNLTSAFLNQLLLPKTAQSTLADQSQTQGQFLAGGPAANSCTLHQQTTVPLSSKNPPENLLASSQIIPSVLSAQSNPSDNLGGAVLAEVDLNHDQCTLPEGDPGAGDLYCMPGNIPGAPDRLQIGPPPDQPYEVFICAVKTCSAPNLCSPVSGDPKTIDIPTSIVLGIPYLESIWNKTTSTRDNPLVEGDEVYANKKTGFWGFFTPSVDTGVLLNQTQFEKYGQTPETEFEGQATGATFPPDQKGLAYPDFIGGVKNAENWVRQALWPGGLSP